ncbi:probable serine incorporator [Paramuricea clavata]|uniref:Probable serine incorporator n=1 Tax=Paramuricea clavata TaxID=317549 RepID=A0A7D9IT33_PARCT|nr:probable serine incorporator [Paramuricea clavata]
MANIQVWVTLFITFSTLIYISIRDLVAPQFGKVEKIDSPVKNNENLKLTYNLQKDGADISQCGNLKGNMKSDNPFTSPKSFDKRTSIFDVSENLKETYHLEGDEDNISPPNIPKDNVNKDIAFTSPKRPFENNKESHSQSKELGLRLSSYSPNTDSPLLKTTTKELSSVNTKNATIQSENTSLVWDNTLFLCVTANLTSYETLPNRPELPVIENSNFTITGTQESLKLTEAKHIAEGAIDFTGKHRSKTPGNSSKSSIESSNFTTTDTEGASTLFASKGGNDFTIDSTEKPITSSNPKCLTNRDSPLTESSDFATKGIPESLSLTALTAEREALFDKSPINLAEEHFTNTSSKTNHSMSPLLENNDLTTKEIPAKDAALIWDDEVDGIEYSYPFFHLTFSLATLYLIMSITNWYRLDEGEHLTVRLVQSWSAVWLRISASIFCSFLLIWSMIIPLVFPDTYKDLLFFQYLTSLPKF